MLPVLRGLSAEGAPKLLHLNTSAEVMAFVNSNELEPLAALGKNVLDPAARPPPARAGYAQAADWVDRVGSLWGS